MNYYHVNQFLTHLEASSQQDDQIMTILLKLRYYGVTEILYIYYNDHCYTLTVLKVNEQLNSHIKIHIHITSQHTITQTIQEIHNIRK